jgi:CRP/FNR family transcriptional regulator, cyclic AMP receptor protein
LPNVPGNGGEALVQPDGREPQGRPSDGIRREAVSLPAIWPEILARVPSEDRELALRALVLPLVSARDEDLADILSTQMPDAFDFLIVDGVVLKETTLARRSALELLGPGDVLAPPLASIYQLESRAVSRYLAHGPVSLATIGPHFQQARSRWPGIADFLHESLGRQTHRASMNLAMLHLARIEDRLIALFADLAERFGHVSADGILLDLPLTHDIIGGLVGSRRPTVTLALQRLAALGVVERLENNRWQVSRAIVST